MPSAKRSRDRITSGNWRPSKSLRFGQGSNSSSEEEIDSNECDDMIIDGVAKFMPVTVYRDHRTSNFTIQPRMRVAQVVAWPNSLAAVKNQFFYNLTPQDGPLLPAHIIQQVSGRIRRTFSDDTVDHVAPSMPYFHLGFTPFLELQAFVFLPNLRSSVCYAQDPGRIYKFILERWTNDVFLSALRQHDSRVPPSWRCVDDLKTSPEWYHEDLSPYPIYKLHNSPANRDHQSTFTTIWTRAQHLSMKVPEFQHSFLVLYSDGQCPQPFRSDGPEAFMHSFEAAWHTHVDMECIPSAEENLKVDFDYSNSEGVKNLVMR